VIGTLVVIGVVFAARPVQRRFNELRSEQALISGDTGDVMASATYQRFKARREAIAAMRSALLAMAAAESTFVADSGRPTSSFLGRYAFPNDRYNLGPTVEIQRDRWIARAGNNHTTIQCTLTAMLDTVTWRYHPGVPVCAEWTAGDSFTLFVLNYLGEGAVVWRYRGSRMRGDMFWDPHRSPASRDTFGLVRPAKTVWWVRIRNATGQEGWIRR